MKPVFVFLILASIATLSLAVPATLLVGKKATLETVSSTEAVEAQQSNYAETLISAPLSDSDANVAIDVQTSMSAQTGNSAAISVKGWWFKVVAIQGGQIGSQNIMKSCATQNMLPPCGHHSYVNHGGGCEPIDINGHWSIRATVQAWGQSSELTAMFNNKYIFVGLGQYEKYAHYNTADDSHRGAGTINGQVHNENPSTGNAVCVSRQQPVGTALVVKGWRFQIADFKGNAGSLNFQQVCRAQGMEAPCDHNSYFQAHGGGCQVIEGFNGHWSYQAHVQSWASSQELTTMMNNKYFFVGLGQYQQYSHYNSAGSHEGAGLHNGQASGRRNPDGGQTVCVAPANQFSGPTMQFKGWWWTVVDFKGNAGSRNILEACSRLGLETPCDYPSYVNHGGGCTPFSEFGGHLSYEPQLKPWANNDQFNQFMFHKYFFVGLNNYVQYSHYNTAQSHEAAGIYGGNTYARNPDGGKTVCFSRNEIKNTPTCQVSEFGPWTPCSKSCGGGVQSRTRTVTKDGSSCPALKQEQACHAQECHTSTSDIGKTVLAALEANLQKLTTTNNNLKADSDRTASLAAAAKTLFDEASNDMATKKSNMEKAMTSAAAAKEKCSAHSDDSVAANSVQAQAVKTSKDSEVIDKELALIAQLKSKLNELTNTKSLETNNLQSSVDITEGVNRAIRVASAGARPETALVFKALEVSAGRQFQESDEINKLLDQLIAKLENEKATKRANVVAATKRAEEAKKLADDSCAASDARKEEVRVLTNSFQQSVSVVDTRREELNTVNGMAATALKSFKDFQASFESEKATHASVADFFKGGMKCSK